MFKYIFYIILLVIIIGVAVGGFHLYKTSIKNKKEMANFDHKKIEFNKNLGRVLVIYYSMNGNTEKIAKKIKTKTNADIYEIKTTKPLPKGPKLYIAIKNQLKNKTYPEVSKDFPDLASYDTIFVGAPVWWYTMATPAFSFLEQADFGGKKVVPFSTQGSNVGTYFEDFNSNVKNAKILKSEQFNNISEKYDDAVDNKISSWLNELDI